MAFPFRDINVQSASDCYIFKSPSTPDAPALTIDRPTGEVRLSDAALLSGKRVSRIFSIKGILGVIQLRLGMSCRPVRRVVTAPDTSQTNMSSPSPRTSTSAGSRAT